MPALTGFILLSIFHLYPEKGLYFSSFIFLQRSPRCMMALNKATNRKCFIDKALIFDDSMRLFSCKRNLLPCLFLVCSRLKSSADHFRKSIIQQCFILLQQGISFRKGWRLLKNFQFLFQFQEPCPIQITGRFCILVPEQSPDILYFSQIKRFAEIRL